MIPYSVFCDLYYLEFRIGDLISTVQFMNQKCFSTEFSIDIKIVLELAIVKINL